jgi:hypothetical protein
MQSARSEIDLKDASIIRRIFEARAQAAAPRPLRARPPGPGSLDDAVFLLENKEYVRTWVWNKRSANPRCAKLNSLLEGQEAVCVEVVAGGRFAFTATISLDLCFVVVV